MAVLDPTTFRGRYLSLTTYKRDGTAVRTPVWFVEEDGRLLVQTDGASAKVKRIRANPRVSVAVCSASGRLRDIPHPARAEVLTAPADIEHIERLIKRKYRRDLPIVMIAWRVKEALHLGRQRGAIVGLELRPGKVLPE
jgi:uncharacterized protein